MFKKLIKIFEVGSESAEVDSQALFASLLVRAARIDNDYSKKEKIQIETILGNKFNITKLEAKEIRIAGELLESKTLDTVQLTREIKKDIPFEYRKELAKDLWSIILADEKRTDDENSFMRTCIKLIGVNDVDSARARQAIIAQNKMNKN